MGLLKREKIGNCGIASPYNHYGICWKTILWLKNEELGPQVYANFPERLAKYHNIGLYGNSTVRDLQQYLFDKDTRYGCPWPCVSDSLQKNDQEGYFVCAAKQGDNCACIGHIIYGRKYAVARQTQQVLITNTLREMMAYPYKEDNSADYGTKCDNLEMGGDPVLGAPKMCYCKGKNEHV